MHYWIVSRPQAAGRQSRTYPGEGERLRVEPPPDALCRVPCDNSSDRVYDGSLHPPTPVAGCYEQSESSRCAWVTCLISQPASLPAQVHHWRNFYSSGSSQYTYFVYSRHLSYCRAIQLPRDPRCFLQVKRTSIHTMPISLPRRLACILPNYERSPRRYQCQHAGYVSVSKVCPPTSMGWRIGSRLGRITVAKTPLPLLRIG